MVYEEEKEKKEQRPELFLLGRTIPLLLFVRVFTGMLEVSLILRPKFQPKNVYICVWI